MIFKLSQRSEEDERLARELTDNLSGQPEPAGSDLRFAQERDDAVGFYFLSKFSLFYAFHLNH